MSLRLHFFFLFIIIKTNSAYNFDAPALYKISDPLRHGECPTWDSRNNILYFVDIFVGKIYSYNYDTQETKSVTVSGQVAPVIPSKADPNLFIIGLNRSIAALLWDQESGQTTVKVLGEVNTDYPESRLNDGKADKEGRLWFGTMGNSGDQGTPDQGSLYKITKDNLKNPQIMVSPVNISNGLAFNKANDRVYYIDSPTLQVSEYIYDNTNGEISDKRTCFDLRDYNLTAHPDGMTIDQDDNLWIALYGGGSVIKVDPKKGVILERIAIPASCVTSVMWGGPDLDVLFVTTSQGDFSEEYLREKEPGAGSVYAITNLKTKGLRVFDADIVDKI